MLADAGVSHVCPGRLYAEALAGVRRRLAGTDDQHPSFAAAVISRARHPRPRTCRRGQDSRLHRAFRHRRSRRRADHRPGGGDGARTTTASRPWRPGCWREEHRIYPPALAALTAGRLRIDKQSCTAADVSDTSKSPERAFCGKLGAEGAPGQTSAGDFIGLEEIVDLDLGVFGAVGAVDAVRLDRLRQRSCGSCRPRPGPGWSHPSPCG